MARPNAMQRAGRFMCWESSFAARLSELAIVITANHYRAWFDGFAYRRLAVRGGLGLTSPRGSYTALWATQPSRLPKACPVRRAWQSFWEFAATARQSGPP